MVAEAGLPIAGVGLAVPGVVADGVLERRAEPPAAGATSTSSPGPPRCSSRSSATHPVSVGNEADLAALAEHRAGAAGDDFLYVSGGIGVGAGIVLGGRLFGGSGGRAGELGHVVVDPAGPPCTCGGRGCLERAAGLEDLCRAAAVDDLDALADAAARREPTAEAALQAGGHALGVALAGAVNLLDVPTVVLGGGYPRLGAVLRAAVADELARRVVWRSPVAVRTSALGAAAALRGAATSVVRAVLDG